MNTTRYNRTSGDGLMMGYENDYLLDAASMNSTLPLLLREILLLDANVSAEFMALSPQEQLLFLQEFEDSYDTPLEVQHERIVTQYALYRADRVINFYLPPLLLFLGTFGNLFAFLILRNKTMTRQSTNLFLATLSVADTLVLLVGLLREWVADLTGMDAQTQNVWMCKTVTVLAYSFSQFSVWLIIAVTIERYIVVSHPLRASRYCNVPRAKKVVALMAVFFLGINLHLFWTVTLRVDPDDAQARPRCEPAVDYEVFGNHVWHWVDAVLYALSPFCIILVFNCMIIRQTIKAKRFRVELQNGPLIRMEKRKSSHDNNYKLTIMLLAVSFTFLITTVPMAFVMLNTDRWNRESKDASLQVRLAHQLLRTIAEMLMYLNHSMNFYLYCALGQKFRNQFLRTICGRSGSNNSNSDHSQHLYCSRQCKISGYHIHKSTDETAV